jgi:hypothetical protein
LGTHFAVTDSQTDDSATGALGSVGEAGRLEARSLLAQC